MKLRRLSTGTLQVQGPQAANFKGFLTKLMGAESNKQNASSQEANLTFAVDLDTEHVPHETVPLSVFTEEIKNIWSEIKTIRGKLVEPHHLNEIEKEGNGNQEIDTLQQKNQDLQNEICTLKDQLREQNNVLKNISEERDSYRTALQIMTKEINAHEETLTLNNAVGQFNKIRGIAEEARGTPSRHQIQKIHILVLITTTSIQENQ